MSLPFVTNNIDDKNRFSVFLLENDVAEYIHYKKKYNDYHLKLFDKRLSTLPARIIRNKLYIKKHKMYYDKYIKKMKYLEEHYRSINNYTNYHAQLENTKIVPCKDFIVDSYLKHSSNNNNEPYLQNYNHFDHNNVDLFDCDCDIVLT